MLSRRCSAGKDNPAPRGELLEGRIGYVFLPQFSSGDQDDINEYATELQQIVKAVDAQHPCGWIIDLRQNRGGNMWPMLAGIGPILGEGQVGAFVDPDENKAFWYYRNGQALFGEVIGAEVTEPAYQLEEPAPPVAVLTARQTVSSGEAVVVAFRHRPNTRSFGRATCGLSTARRAFPLDDGATIFLTDSTFADRTGQLYGGPIAPDEIAAISRNAGVPQAAIDWLPSRPACAMDGP